MSEQSAYQPDVVITPPIADVAQVLVNGRIVATIERRGHDVTRVTLPNGLAYTFGTYATACQWVLDHAGAWAQDEPPPA